LGFNVQYAQEENVHLEGHHTYLTMNK